MSKNDLLQQSDIIRQRPGNIVSDMDGEKVMLSVESGNYYNLGQIGGRIWELIEQPASIGDIVSQLISEYDIDPDTCLQQILPFLNHLHEEGLIGLTVGALKEQ